MASDNLNAIKTQWLEILRSTKSEQLKKELSILSQVFERSLDRKESIKEGLLKDIAEAEEQFIMAKRNHLQSVDKLISMYIYVTFYILIHIYQCWIFDRGHSLEPLRIILTHEILFYPRLSEKEAAKDE